MCYIFQFLNDRFYEGSDIISAIFQGIGSPTLLCILGSHMLFNLKEAAERGVNVGTNWSSYPHSDIRFESPGHQELHFEFVNIIIGFNLNTLRLTSLIPFADRTSFLVLCSPLNLSVMKCGACYSHIKYASAIVDSPTQTKWTLSPLNN